MSDTSDPITTPTTSIGLSKKVRALDQDYVFLASGMLPFCDFACLLMAAYMTAQLYVVSTPELLAISDHVYLLVTVAALAPALLYDRRFATLASRRQHAALVRCFVVGFAMFVGAIFALGFASRALDELPMGALAIWIAMSFVFTAFVRALLAANIQRLERKGALIERIAVVGAGPVAARLIVHLRQTRPYGSEVIGVFDDVVTPIEGKLEQATAEIAPQVNGTIDDLIALGQSRSIDWILVTLPPSEEVALQSIVQRLKALATPVALCPHNIGLHAKYRTVDYIDDFIPVTLLADPPRKQWQEKIRSWKPFVPRWITTLGVLPEVAAVLFAPRVRRTSVITPQPQRQHKTEKVTCIFDDFNLATFADEAAMFGSHQFGYVVTPNVDHLIRLHDDHRFRELYASARYVLLDSQFLANLLQLIKGTRLPVCAGSDLTARLFKSVIAADDPLVIVGSKPEQIAQLSAEYGLTNVIHYEPPMGFIRDPEELERCLTFIESHTPFRFCLIAVGAPQQEILAELLQSRGKARGLALCIGASINFLTGDEKRAPRWMRRMGFEWLFRLLQSPARLATRYLIRGPRVFALLHKTKIILRTHTEPIEPRPKAPWKPARAA